MGETQPRPQAGADILVQCLLNHGVEVVCRDTAHFTELLTRRLHQVDGVVSAESFLVLEIHKMAYGWGVGEVATTANEDPPT